MIPSVHAIDCPLIEERKMAGHQRYLARYRLFCWDALHGSFCFLQPFFGGLRSTEKVQQHMINQHYHMSTADHQVIISVSRVKPKARPTRR